MQSALTDMGRLDVVQNIMSDGGAPVGLKRESSGNGDASAYSNGDKDYETEGTESSGDNDDGEYLDDASPYSSEVLNTVQLTESAPSTSKSRRSSTLDSMYSHPISTQPLSSAAFFPSASVLPLDRPVKEPRSRQLNRTQSGDTVFPTSLANPTLPLMAHPTTPVISMPPPDHPAYMPPPLDYSTQVYLQSLFPEYTSLSPEDLSVLLFQASAGEDPGAPNRGMQVDGIGNSSWNTTHLFSSIPLEPSMAGKKRRVDGTTSTANQSPQATVTSLLVREAIQALGAHDALLGQPGRRPSVSPSQAVSGGPSSSPIMSTPASAVPSNMSDGDSSDPLSQAIRLRDRTTYFDAAARARYRRGEKMDPLDFAVEDFVAATSQSIAAGRSSKPGSSASGVSSVAQLLMSSQSTSISKLLSRGPVLPVTAPDHPPNISYRPETENDPEVAALTRELERLGMNPSQRSLKLMRRMAPEIPETRWDLLHA
ncbi:hypothetical protein HDU93_004795 [Gonapodya sp. JEL0774]|nr:hypothetical protein HDU93_004795 [Gonapodya sp. JEL0774]